MHSLVIKKAGDIETLEIKQDIYSQIRNLYLAHKNSLLNEWLIELVSIHSKVFIAIFLGRNKDFSIFFAFPVMKMFMCVFV